MSSNRTSYWRRFCPCLRRCAFLILKNFKNGRWPDSYFFPAKNRPVVRIPQQDSAERAFNSHNLCSTKWRRSSDSAAVSKRCRAALRRLAVVNGQQCRLARSSGVCRGEFQCWASASEARFAKNVAPIIREIKSTGRRGGVGPAVGIFEPANASSFHPGAGPRPKCRHRRRQSSKTQVNPGH